jgi:hypothetical protein
MMDRDAGIDYASKIRLSIEYQNFLGLFSKTLTLEKSLHHP